MRVKGEAARDALKMAELFGPIEVVTADLFGEYGFVTGVFTEKEFAERAAKTDAIIHRIRMEG